MYRHMVYEFYQFGELGSTALTPFYSIFISMWATLMTEYWKRKERTLAVEWDMHEHERLQGTRAEFIGDEDVSARRREKCRTPTITFSSFFLHKDAQA